MPNTTKQTLEKRRKFAKSGHTESVRQGWMDIETSKTRCSDGRIDIEREMQKMVSKMSSPMGRCRRRLKGHLLSSLYCPPVSLSSCSRLATCPTFLRLSTQQNTFNDCLRLKVVSWNVSFCDHSVLAYLHLIVGCVTKFRNASLSLFVFLCSTFECLSTKLKCIHD